MERKASILLVSSDAVVTLDAAAIAQLRVKVPQPLVVNSTGCCRGEGPDSAKLLRVNPGWFDPEWKSGQ